MALSSDLSDLNDRSLLLFKSLVEHFIKDGQPVSSRTLARDSDIKLSPATVRNVMADLEELELLHSPHTSAGRVPTAKGYRLFVDSLLNIETLDFFDVGKIAKEFESQKDISSLPERTSNILSSITQLAGVVMLPRVKQTVVQQIEFVTLSDNRILVILVINDREVQNRIIYTARPYSSAELKQASNYLNQIIAGEELTKVHSEILKELEQIKNNVNQLMQTAIEMAQKVFAHDDADDDLVFSGQTNLMEASELCDLNRLKKLFDSFNQKRDILHLLEQSINANGVRIFIGEESGYDVLDNCSIVTSPYGKDGQILGVLGVIGPTRMHYERVIPIVDITARMLSSALNSKN